MLPLLLGLAIPAFALDVDLGGPYTVDAEDTVELSVDVTDADGCTTLEYSWDLDGDGTVDETATDLSTTTFDAAGLDGPVVVGVAVGVACKVADLELDRARDEADVEVQNVPPVLGPVELEDPIIAGDTVLLRTSAEDVEAGDRLTISWDFGDEETARGEEVAHRWETPGTYDVFVVAKDDDGGEDRWDGTVEVLSEDEPGDSGGDGGGDDGGDSGTDGGTDSGTTDGGADDGGGRDTFVDGQDTGGSGFAPEYEIVGTGCSCGSGGAAALLLPMLFMGWRRRD